MSGLKESQHLELPLKEIELATKSFLTCIGKGGYVRVYKGELSMAGKHTMVAVKRLHENLGQGLKEFLTEIYLLTGQQHPNVVSLLGYCQEGNEKILVYEYAERGSLDEYIRPSDTTYCLSWVERLKICVDAASGLDHLHSHVGQHQSIIHRDIKSANILLDDKWVAKISDLGLSRLSFAGLNRSAVISHACGTPGYCEPEYIISGIVTKKSDVYSFGMVLFEVLCGRLCRVREDDGLFLSCKLAKEYYENRKMAEIVHPILRKQISTVSMYNFAEIAYGCLQEDRETRPHMDVVTKKLEETLKTEQEMIMKLKTTVKNVGGKPHSSTKVVGPTLDQSHHTSHGAAIRDLIVKAVNGPLAQPDEQALLELLSVPELVYYYGLAPSQLTELVENNPLIAVEALIKLVNSPEMFEYFAALVNMDLSSHLEFVSRLTKAVELPAELLQMYITKCISLCENIKDKYKQNLSVNLVCHFLLGLIRNQKFYVQDQDHFTMVMAFSRQFIFIRSASGLCRRLKTLE